VIGVLQRENYVFRRFPRDIREQPPINEEERWELLAFSLYTRIAKISSMALAALELEEPCDAVPDLLAALKAIRQTAQGVSYSDGADDIVTTADAAIAKAEGR
jgi:hypothetical protein